MGIATVVYILVNSLEATVLLLFVVEGHDTFCNIIHILCRFIVFSAL
jgi:hypothetical protein